MRGFYARSEMWRAMGLSTGLALLVFPLYLLGGRVHGVEGLALASVAAISLNALVTVGWLWARTAAPDLLALAETSVRSFAIVTPAGLAALASLQALADSAHGAFVALLVGGAVYGAVALVGVRLIGDGPMRSGIDRVLERVRRGLRRSRRP